MSLRFQHRMSHGPSAHPLHPAACGLDCAGGCRFRAAALRHRAVARRHCTAATISASALAVYPPLPIESVSRLTEQEVTPGTAETAFSTRAAARRAAHTRYRVLLQDLSPLSPPHTRSSSRLFALLSIIPDIDAVNTVTTALHRRLGLFIQVPGGLTCILMKTPPIHFPGIPPPDLIGPRLYISRIHKR